MIINISTQLEYIPEWNGNKNDAEPITITHLAPTQELYGRLVPKPQFVVKYDKDLNPDGGETVMVIDNTKLVKDMVTGIRNLEVVVDGKPLKITTGRELFGPGVPSVLSGLVDEIGAYLQSTLAKKSIDVKN